MSQVEHAGHDAAAVRMWVTNPMFGYLLGLDQSGNKVVDAIRIDPRGHASPQIA